jgi:hypothetical protein
MKKISVIILFLNMAWSATLLGDYCATDEHQKAVGCSLMVRVGDSMDPVIIFSVQGENETRVWKLGVRIMNRELLMLNGDSLISVDGGEARTSEFISAQRTEVTKDWLSESAWYVISEDTVREIAESRDGVLFEFSADKAGPVEISVTANQLGEVDSVLAEAKERL